MLKGEGTSGKKAVKRYHYRSGSPRLRPAPPTVEKICLQGGAGDQQASHAHTRTHAHTRGAKVTHRRRPFAICPAISPCTPPATTTPTASITYQSIA